MDSNTHFFYQRDKLTGLQVGGQHRTLFRVHDLPLAETSAQALSQNSLLSVDEKGSVLASHERSYNYSAHGHVPALCSVLGFNGERHEPVSRSYLLGNGYRAFSPVLLRFLAPDSWSPFGAGGLNAYGYCSGDPVNRVDPSGHINFSHTYRPSYANRTRTLRLERQNAARRAVPPSGQKPKRVRAAPAQQNVAPVQQQPRNPPAHAGGEDMFGYREANGAHPQPDAPNQVINPDIEAALRQLIETHRSDLRQEYRELLSLQNEIPHAAPGTDRHNQHQASFASIQARFLTTSNELTMLINQVDALRRPSP